MNEDLKRNAFYEEPWYDLKQMSEGCKECAYRADETHCRLYCRFLDVQGQCRCFHMGILQENDLLLLISNSGKTREIVPAQKCG